LAQDEAQVFFFDRDMFKPITSVFNLVKKEELSDGMWTLSFDEEHLQIEVSPNTKQIIDEARNNPRNKAVLLNSIYFAAAMQAIQKLKESKDEYESKKWAEVILKQAFNKSLDLDSHDAYWLTEKLMQEPLKRMNEFVFKGTE